MKIIKYILTNSEPIKIINKQRGGENQLETLRYITGSAIRGIVINLLSDKFNDYKSKILSDSVRFFNAYPVAKNKIAIPSPKIYYAVRTNPNQIFSIFSDKVPEGAKRADMGDFCILNGKEAEIIKVKLGENMSNNIGKKEVFRSQNISANQEFGGYIIIDNDDELADEILEIIKDCDVSVGSGTSKGYGKCRITAEYTDIMPYSEYRADSFQDTVTMLCISDVTMLNTEGEPCGIDTDYIADFIGMKSCDVIESSTTTFKSFGRNRKWECDIPSVTMYEKGSVFRLKFDKEISDVNRLYELQNKGIGIRRGEGFGQIVFTDALFEDGLFEDGEKKESKEPIITVEETEGYKEDEDVKKAIKVKLTKMILEDNIEKYILENNNNGFDRLSKSQLGVILSILSMFKNNPDNAIARLKNFFDNKGKRTSTISKKYENIKKYISNLFDRSIKDILEINNNAEIDIDISNDSVEMKMIKLDLLEKQIRFYLRKEGAK